MRIIDSNINRVCEGFRVLEDIFRFNYNNFNLSKDLKMLRHKVRDSLKSNDTNLLEHRDVNSDLGPKVTKSLNLNRDKSIISIVCGNFKRIQEGLRTLEELTKTIYDIVDYSIYELIRYQVYNLEKKAISFLSRSHFTLPPLYAITYHEVSQGRSNIEVVREIIKSGIKLIQYREKKLSFLVKYKECLEIRQMTRKAGVCFIVNDHIDIAKLVDADGVHLGQDDLPINVVRNLIGINKIIGLSTHSQEQAIKAVKDGVDYIGVGPIFSTQTKENVCDPVGYSYLEWVEKNIDIPYVVIGGIKESNIKEILNRGAKSIALVSEITGNKNIPNKVQKLNNILKEYTNEI
ncbi:MAG: thiamine phosphate synthase [Spirochaetaceae bacterium]